MKHFCPIEQVFPEFFQERKWLLSWKMQHLYRNWAHMVGEEIARYSAPAVLREDCLWLYVKHNIWGQELLFRQNEIVDKMRKAEPELDIRSIRCVVRPDWFAAPEKAEIPRIETAPPLPASFAAIPDTACREALARLWRLTHAEREKE